MSFVILGITLLIAFCVGGALGFFFGLPGVILSLPAGWLIGMVGGQIAIEYDRSRF